MASDERNEIETWPTRSDRERRAVRVLIAVDGFSPAQIERIREAARDWAEIQRIPQSAPLELYRAALEEAEIVIGWPDPQLLARGVRLVQLGSSGWDAYEDKGLESCGIALCSGRSVYSIGVAEHCLAMMFALTRRLTAHFRDQQQGIFRQHHPYGEIAGSTACIVGLGSIGAELAARCKGVGMRVIAVVREPSKRTGPADAIFPADALKIAIRQADHVFMTASGGRQNQKLFNREVLEAFRPTTYFYNVSRGSTVDEAALCELLAQGRIAGAGLDVAQQEPPPEDSPLWTLGENVLITGHSAGYSQHHLERFCKLVIGNLENFHRGEPLENRVI